MPKAAELTDRKFGNLTVLGRTCHDSKRCVWWECLCVCGKKCRRMTGILNCGGSCSCGCRGGQNMYLEPGRRFGYLQLVEQAEPDKYGHKMWRCICDCGKTSTSSSANLIQGTTRSRGCKRRVDRQQHGNWKGCGEIASGVWRTFKRSAVRRGIDFADDLSVEYVWGLFISQDMKCALSGIQIHFADTVKTHGRGMTTASLDRIDSRVGYQKGNVQWVHKHLNKMKWCLAQDYFIELCLKVACFHGRTVES